MRCMSCMRGVGLHVIRETRTLDTVNRSIQDVLAGTVTARIVFDLRDKVATEPRERQLTAAVL